MHLLWKATCRVCQIFCLHFEFWCKWRLQRKQPCFGVRQAPPKMEMMLREKGLLKSSEPWRFLGCCCWAPGVYCGLREFTHQCETPRLKCHWIIWIPIISDFNWINASSVADYFEPILKLSGLKNIQFCVISVQHQNPKQEEQEQNLYF